MVKIRLKRMGATKRPFYRLVVADSRSPRDGRFIEEIGVYDPVASPSRVEIDADKVRDWMRKGARPSDTARKLLEQQGILPRTPRPMGPPKESKKSAANGAAAAAQPEAATPDVAAGAQPEPTPEVEGTAPGDAAADSGEAGEASVQGDAEEER